VAAAHQGLTAVKRWHGSAHFSGWCRSGLMDNRVRTHVILKTPAPRFLRTTRCRAEPLGSALQTQGIAPVSSPSSDVSRPPEPSVDGSRLMRGQPPQPAASPLPCPVSRACATQRIALDAPTRKCAAAARRDMPPSTSSDYTLTQIGRNGCRHAHRSPLPVDSLNQNQPDLGIPNDSIWSGPASKPSERRREPPKWRTIPTRGCSPYAADCSGRLTIAMTRDFADEGCRGVARPWHILCSRC
jgi:hypothetical protein